MAKSIILMKPLSPSHRTAQFACGDFLIIYVLDPKTHAVGFRLLPQSKENAVVAPRQYVETPEVLALPSVWRPLPAYQGEISLVQIKLGEDDSGGHFSGGRTMRTNPTVEGLRFSAQIITRSAKGLEIRTELAGARSFRCVHILDYCEAQDAVSLHVEFINDGNEGLNLEMLSSFCLGYLSPFDQEDSVERIRVHRFRSTWSAEGRHEDSSLEELHLERSWASHSAVSERFGQIGSMPVRGFFPFVAIEDRVEGVFWAAQLACPSSWQMEIYRRDDKLSISGGLADREFGHWMKRISPGETFVTPTAFLTTCAGNLEQCCQRLTRMQETSLVHIPAVEAELPIVFNEWCSTWGFPTPAFIAETAQRLAATPVKIFVIDDGWAEKPVGSLQFNGDWNVDKGRFPNGLMPVTNDLRQRGFIPGIWFEFEICTEGTDAFALTDHKLKRDGRILKVGSRHFWDFTDPWTFEYLTKKVIRRLKEDGFGYLKVDYNDTIGLGCDDPDSLGEGLRKHLVGVQAFFRLLRQEIPELIIEMCSSGGHRLEPSMLALASQASFSDAHESTDIPIIAANLHLLILPRQSQIWAVLHAEDSLQRIQYSLAACFLGRLCLSGKITTLSETQFDLVKANLEFYQRVKHIIRNGESRIHRQMNESYRHPRGWQAVTRALRPMGAECLVVIHVFDTAEASSFRIPLPEGVWQIKEHLGDGLSVRVDNSNSISTEVTQPYSSYIVYLSQSFD